MDENARVSIPWGRLRGVIETAAAMHCPPSVDEGTQPCWSTRNLEPYDPGSEDECHECWMRYAMVGD